jgi:hypothetical protein
VALAHLIQSSSSTELAKAFVKYKQFRFQALSLLTPLSITINCEGTILTPDSDVDYEITSF